jgi:hypothetical protein
MSKNKFSVFMSYLSDDARLASILKIELQQHDIGIYDNSDTTGVFISMKTRESIRKSVCLIAILTTNSFRHFIINREIAYAMGIGLEVIVMIENGLCEHIEGDIKKVEFTDENFITQCKNVTIYVSELLDLFDEPIDVDSFVDSLVKDESVTNRQKDGGQ